MREVTHLKQFIPGQRVAVSDGTPKPPERFNKKLAAWERYNFEGTVDGIEEPRDYSPNGCVRIEMPKIGGFMRCVNVMPFRPDLTFTIIEEAFEDAAA